MIKEQSAAELICAIREARTGHAYLSPSIADQVGTWLSKETDGHQAPEPEPDKRFMLTQREEQVLDLLSLSKTNRDIGQTLGISPRTVEVHRTNLMHKLGLESYTDLERFIRRKKSGGEPPAPEGEPTPDC